jgi:uncharacterized phage infection (PIP) family protein YhgE
MTEQNGEPHPIAERARNLVTRLDSLEDVAEEHQQPVLRAKASLEQLISTVRASNPLLLSTRALDPLSDQLTALENALPVLEGTATTATGADFEGAIEELLYRLSDVLVIQRPEDAEPVRTAIAGVTEFAKQQTASLRTALDELAASIEEAKAHTESSIATLKEDLSELTAAIQVQKEELNTALESQKALFETEQKNREATFATKLEEILAEHKTVQTKVVEDGEESVKEVLQRAEGLANQIDKRKEEVEATAEAVGLTATISGFTGYADQQKKSADWWRRGAVAALVAIVALGLATLAWSDEADFTLQQSLLKGSIGTALAILAGYAGTQSGHHRREERRSRRLGLEVAAFDPYVANLDTDRQKALKEFMALRVFGHLEDPDTDVDKWGEHQPSAQKVMDLLRRDKGE